MRATIRRQQEEILALRRQLEQAASSRATFLSASAHELKTPLSVIQSYLETLLYDLSQGMSAEQLSFLRITFEAVLRLRRLVIDLVDLAALESGALHLDIARVEVRQVLSAVHADMLPIARRTGVQLEVAPGDALPPVRGDRERVEQVLRNLVDNAVKYTPAGGQVLVHGHPEPDTVALVVEDTGAGIPNEQLATIFDEFVRLRPAPARDVRGSGLGLPICRRVVRALGGRITVESTEGQGSVFIVHLPRWPEEGA
jgi:signal transduction histidine kinase